jgi:DNA-binding MarR family transcriptional regulator
MTTNGTERTEAVQALFDGLLQFSRSLRSRSGDWSQTARDLSRGDTVTLGVVERQGSTRPGQIAAALGVDPSVVSRQLAALDRLGLIARCTDPSDRRAERISVTPLGHERLVQARAAMCDALAERLTGWDLEAISHAATVVGDVADLLHDTDTDITHIADSKDAHA